MNSMPEPTTNSERINDTIEVADGHVVHTCCGKLDDEEHRNFCEHYRQTDSIVADAIRALTVYQPQSPQQAADMLLFWVRRHEMTDVDLAEIQRRMFPNVMPDDSTEYGKGYADGYVAGIAAAKATMTKSAAQLVEETAQLWAAENRANAERWAAERPERLG